MEINDCWNIPIDKLMYWRVGSWVKYENKKSNLSLRLHCDQLIITNNNKVLESLNMHGKMKGIYKEDVLILIVCTSSHEIRKLKFQIKNNPAQHLQKLGEHFVVISHNSGSKSSNLKYRNVEDVFKSVLEDYTGNAESSNLPSNYNEFIKLCLLDPAFPQVVHETQKIIKSQILKKN